MSSPAEADDEDVEFVSEGPLRPISACIDLLSDSEEEGSSSTMNTIEDQIDRQKARVASTLDKLAHQVAAEKRERADKCRAFKERQISQKVHRQQELALSSRNGTDHDAKRCVDMWLKMPGPTPGVINSGFRRRSRPPPFPSSSLTKHTCPVINCGRVFDGGPLLEGHLKRFDHSPCDPTVLLKGSPAELLACVACGRHFESRDGWKVHLQSKVSSANAEGHTSTQTCQPIVCFACPACYLLFNLKDECLQHMSAKNHFSQSSTMTGPSGTPRPVPIPRYAKNRLITLCSEVPFSVKCTLCRKVLSSHQKAQAHFNVQCRQGCAIAEADRTVAQVMEQMQPRGQCSLCSKIFLSQAELESHRELTQHEVEVNHTAERAILRYCSFRESQLARRPNDTRETREVTGSGKRDKKREHAAGSPAKRQRLSPSVNGDPGGRGGLVLAWFCECNVRFSEEEAANKHLFAANQIFHQCGVCGKHMGESAVARLHMSRFHGGAHLSNILYHCRLCKVDMPRREDILLHVSEAHSGHTYFTEREVPEEPSGKNCDAKPSTSNLPTRPRHTASVVRPAAASTPDLKSGQQWMCRMCEDIFDSEGDARRHCSDMSKHSFQRFVCGHCPQKFFKHATLRMHCAHEHGGKVEFAHFCGLCDSIPFNSEAQFLEHYEKIHSIDYFCMDDGQAERPPAVEESAEPLPTTSEDCEDLCPCMGSEKSQSEAKTVYTRCMRSLAAQGACVYLCLPCGVSATSYAQINGHVHSTHPALNLDKTFDVECSACAARFTGVPPFHLHYHSQHCPLKPCLDTNERRQTPEASDVSSTEAMEVQPSETVFKDTQASKLESDHTKLKCYQNDHDISLSHVHHAEIEDPKLTEVLSLVKNESETNEDDEDEDVRRALALSAEEATRESAELEEALQRSLLEF